MSDKKSDKKKSELTDVNTFWKLIIIVIVAIVAEAILLGFAMTEDNLDWSEGQIINNRKVVEKVVENNAVEVPPLTE